MASSSSLKGYVPALAKHLGTTPAALYERQRALVRGEILVLGEGRGPGTGVRVTWNSVAVLLLAALSTDSLTEVYERTRLLAKLQHAGGDLCPFTHASQFRTALEICLSSAKSHDVISITVSRTSARATIRYLEDNVQKISEFVGRSQKDSAISVSATINSAALREIAEDLTAIMLENFEEDDQ